MKKSLLLACLLIGTLAIQAQTVCFPNPIFVLAGLPGLWPNPQTGPLSDGNINQAYSEVITVVVPADTTIDISQFGLPIGVITVSVGAFDITGVSGLPAGMTSACNVANCSWAGGDNGCLKLSGTPTVAGVYTVDCSTSITINIPNFGPFTTPPRPVTYDLTILGPTATSSPADLGYRLFAPRPNPASGSARIEFSLPASAEVQVSLVDLQGRTVMQSSLNGNAGANTHDLNLHTVAPGLYLVDMLADGQRLSTKLLVE